MIRTATGAAGPVGRWVSRARWYFLAGPGGFYAERMLDLARIDVEEIAEALADQTDYEHRWLIDPRTGEVAFWTSDTGIDGQNTVDIDELDLVPIDPLSLRLVPGHGRLR